jgi:hypothetical protein
MKLTQEILDEFKETCRHGDNRIHLTKLKFIANQIRARYPDLIKTQTQSFHDIMALDAKKCKKTLLDILCGEHEGKVMGMLAGPSQSTWPTPKPTPAPVSKKESPKTRSSSPIEQTSIRVNAKPADGAYMAELKAKIDAQETKSYSVESLRQDIKDDEFIKKAINGHVQLLNYKFKHYTKLSKFNFQEGGFPGANKDKDGVNLNAIIQELLVKITDERMKWGSFVTPQLIEQKRKQLHSMLFDEDYGIVTIKGKSRNNVRVAFIKMIYMFIKVPEFFSKSFINFMITGPAGSGKTKIATVLSHIMKSLGILITNKVVMATKQTLVATHIGQTGPKTRNLLASNIEGVIFIDEAYTITPCPDQIHGNSAVFSEEAIGELINFMDKFIGCMVIIVAGYKQKMYECFLPFNEGLARRFPKTI